MKKIAIRAIVIIAVLVVIYQFGPKPEAFESSAAVPPKAELEVSQQADIAAWISQTESYKEIRPGNESQIYWADSTGRRTKYVLLYLHGFSASPVEGNPVNLAFAKRYGMNMYAPLLYAHGLIEKENMLTFTAEKWTESVQNALAIARAMGDSVIIMSTSTGCTSALFLASEPSNNVHALINYSPNIRVFDKRASLLAGPWGLQIARLVKGGNYHQWEAPRGAEKFWHTTYRLEAVVEMQKLLEATMVDQTFQNITAPTFVGYYYKDEVHQDDVVSVAAILEMYEKLSAKQKHLEQFTNVGAHAMANSYFSQDIDAVQKASFLFAEATLQLKPLESY